MTHNSATRALLILLSILALSGLVAARPGPAGRRLPRLILAVRTPDPGGLVPGLGPSGRFLARGGHLVVREPDGRTHPFLDPRPGELTLFDVSDPAVSWDARTVVVAGTIGPDAPWRLYTCDASGHGLRPLMPEGGNWHDIDPVWLPEGRIAFASTRFSQRAEQGAVPVTNLFSVWPDGSELRRITTDRNGAEEPTIDPRDGRIVYARWWFSRYRAPVVPSDTLTVDAARAMPGDPVDLWHAIAIRADGEGMRLAGGWPRIRFETMAYQPAVLADGTLVGVQAEVGSFLATAGGAVGIGAHRIVAYPGGFARAVVVAHNGVAPCALDGNRLLVSAPGRRGDLALFLATRPGEGLVPILDTPGLDDLDAALFMPRPAPPALAEYLPPPRRDAPVIDRAPLDDLEWTFRFDCLNVFANGDVDSPFPDAPPIAKDVRIRFFAVLERGDGRPDSIVLVREAPVTATGAVHEHDMPADTPMFEQLVDGAGRVLRSTGGPSHVPGFNFGRFGTGTKCVGCHSGHSAMPVARNYSSATWTNIGPSAVVTSFEAVDTTTEAADTNTEAVDTNTEAANSTTEAADTTTLGVRASSGSGGTGGVSAAAARRLVDRRAKGPVDEVGCRLGAGEETRIRLKWPFLVEVKEVILYATGAGSTAPVIDRAGSAARIRLTDITFHDADRPIHQETDTRDLIPAGTRIAVEGLKIDALDLVFRRSDGLVPSAGDDGIAEIEVIGRLIDG